MVASPSRTRLSCADCRPGHCHAIVRAPSDAWIRPEISALLRSSASCRHFKLILDIGKAELEAGRKHKPQMTMRWRSFPLVCSLLLFRAAAFAESNQPAQAFASRPFRAGPPRAHHTAPGVSINGYFNDGLPGTFMTITGALSLLDDGKPRLAIAVCDSCMIPAETDGRGQTIIQRRADIPADHVLISPPTRTPRRPASASCKARRRRLHEISRRTNRRRGPARREQSARRRLLGCGQRAEPGFQRAGA